MPEPFLEQRAGIYHPPPLLENRSHGSRFVEQLPLSDSAPRGFPVLPLRDPTRQRSIVRLDGVPQPLSLADQTDGISVRASVGHRHHSDLKRPNRSILRPHQASSDHPATKPYNFIIRLEANNRSHSNQGNEGETNFREGLSSFHTILFL